MSNTSESFILDIAWEAEGLPPLVGPFVSEAEAVAWGELNIPNGSWSVRALRFPYLRTSGRRSA